MRPVRPRRDPTLIRVIKITYREAGGLCSPTDAMAGESGAPEGDRRPPPGRAPELRLPAPRAALAAGRSRRAAAEVLAGGAAPRRLRRPRPRRPAGGGD